jgi:hypothetical protein
MTRTRLAALAAAFSLFAIPAALANSEYNGTWVVDVPAANYIESAGAYRCPALRFPLQIQDGHITGMLTRVPTSNPGVTVEAGRGPDAAPVTGTVGDGGIVAARWLDYHANGQLADKTGTVTIYDECGPRHAVVYRVK